MFLDPKKITVPLDAVLKEAQDYEAQGNKLRAEVGYRIAGGISLYKGDVEGVNKYFAKAASFAGDSHPEYQIILKRSSGSHRSPQVLRGIWFNRALLADIPNPIVTE
jgi:hypothetical protein